MRNMGNTSAGQGTRNLKSYNELGGAGDRDRTDDIQLGKLTFYH
jgi:hypothetical protein